MMNNLPLEVVMMIIQKLPVSTCLKLVETSKEYSWIPNDIPLWRHFVDRDIGNLTRIFDLLLEGKGLTRIRTPMDIYHELSICRFHQIK